MVQQVNGYKTTSGKLFATRDEAESCEIAEAAEVLAGAEKNHLINLAHGYSTCRATREAIFRLAEAIGRAPVPGPIDPGV